MLKRWINLQSDMELVSQISKEIGVSPVVTQVMINRGIKTVEQAGKYLFPSFKDLHNPFLLNDMKEAVDTIIDCIKNRRKITIYGDYDVDGVMSVTLLMLFLIGIGVDTKYLDYYIPLRDEGYGMNKNAIDEIKSKDGDLIITVDCGITSVDLIDYAKTIGLTVIVTDHHEPSDVLPRACAVINPKREDSTYPFRELAGVGVAYKLATAIQKTIKNPSFSEDLREFFDIVAFGTIADIVPLKDENRFIVKNGLELLNDKENVRRGFKQLITVCGLLDKEIKAGHVGFYLAPRINALGRLDDVKQAVEMFLSDNDDYALGIARILDDENKERQEIEKKMLKEAMSQLPPPEEYKDRVIILADKNWHTGVKGIVASKLLDQYYKPVIICSVDEDNMASGSARSIEGFNMKNALDKCEDILVKYGGHEMAAGMTFKLEDLDKFRTRMNEVANEMLTEEDLIPKVKYDSLIGINDITFAVVEQLDNLQPFGQSNPSPSFAIEKATVLEAKTVGSDKKHLKLKIQEAGHIIEGIAFGLGYLEEELKEKGLTINVACALGINEWQGRQTLQLEIKDIQLNKKIIDPELEKMEEIFKEAELYIETSDYAHIGERETFYTKIVGVTFDDRQITIDNLELGEELFLIRDKNNPKDSNAIKVVRKNEEEVGFLKAKMAKILSRYIDKGIQYKCEISSLTGEINQNKGVNVLITRLTPLNKRQVTEVNSEFRNKIKNCTDKEIFSEIKLKLLGLNNFRYKQIESITHLLNNNNTTTIMGTGRGKSAIFQSVAAFKAIKENKMTIIIYPLRALVNDQLNSMQENLSPLGLKVIKATGDITPDNKKSLWTQIEANEVDVILTTPEFLTYYIDNFKEYRNRFGLIVIDEGHHVGKATDSYRPAYKKLNKVFDVLGNPLLSLMTATCEDDTFKNINKTLNIDKLVIDPAVRNNLVLVDKRNTRNKEEYIKNIISNGDKTIVYVNSREKTVEIAKKLRKELPQMADKIGFYHAGLSSDDRMYIESIFRNDKLSVIVATSAFGEGVNIPNIRHIIHYHMTFNQIEFNQESGRAGRDGNKAYIHLLFGTIDAKVNEFILEKACPSKEVLAKIYTFLRHITEKGTKRVDINLEEMALTMKQIYLGQVIVEETILNSLMIFEELGFLTVKESSNIYFVEFTDKQEKMELSSSIRYQEGLLEQQEFEVFKNWVLNSSSRELLRAINRPIYPVQLEEIA